MPVHDNPGTIGLVFTIVFGSFVLAILLWWWSSSERKLGPALPFSMIGTFISAIIVEPVFDSTLLYWYPPENDLGLYNAFGRTIPLFVPIGYAWFFGGSAYIVWRLLRERPTLRRFWTAFGVVVCR